MKACPVAGCGYSTSRLQNLTQHMRQHTGDLPFKCNAGCSAAFASSSGLAKHKLLHARAHVTCPEPGCGFAAASRAAQVWHMRKSGHAACIECPLPNCGMAFRSSSSLSAHRRGPAHAGAGGRAQCRACAAEFDTAAEYTLHVRAHRVERLAAALAARRAGRGAAASPLL